MAKGTEKALSRNAKLLESAVKTLTHCKYFQTMSPELLHNVLSVGKYLEVPAKTVLIKDGALDDDIYFLLDGSLSVLSGGKMVLRLNEPGDIAGEFAVVSSSPRSADVVTDTPSSLIKVTSKVVKDPNADPRSTMQFLSVFSHIMAAKLRETSTRARLYEDAVLEAKDLATSHQKLETDVKSKLQEIRLYSQVIEASSEAVVIVNDGGHVLFFNPMAESQFSDWGIPLGQWSHTLAVLFRDFDFNGYDITKAPYLWRGEWVRGENLDRLVLQVAITPISEEGTGGKNAALQIRDITLQRTQDEAIKAKNEEVQQALRNLEATYQELQRSDKLKTETLNVISGELSNPIRNILNHAGKLVQAVGELSPEDIASHVRSVYDQTEYLRIISENINYLSELQMGFQQGGLVALDLCDLIRRVCSDLNTWAQRNDVAFKLKLPEAGIQMIGDTDQLTTVFNLLIEQAMLAAKPKTRILVSGRYEVESDQIEVEIGYEGPSLKNIDPSESDRRGRMGLMIGLPLARKVISQYQGVLQFTSREGLSITTIRFPGPKTKGEERPNRIMIVDESEMDLMIAKGVIDHLWPNSVVYTAREAFEFLENYEDFKPDLVIIDPAFSEAGWANHRVLASLSQHRRHIAPVLAVSILYKDFAERTIAVERGVTDFLAKPFSIFDLRFKVKSLLQSHRKEESLQSTMDQAQRQAYTDGLTRLANRKHFDEFLETQVEYSRQTGKPCSLIMVDVDNFKHYNDTNGHQMGDEVLRRVSEYLRTSVRSSDLPARYGGEEFSVVLPETGKEMATVIAEKIRRAIRDGDFPNGEKQPLGFLSASFGIATITDDADSSISLIKAADAALYEAKKQGRNRVMVAGRNMGITQAVV
ncbi:MAG: diguanylate cyclase [Deltaproteobacteria bacterium]|nr:diguanylate cyclase [Deltaproteobacteria bacterium]